MPSAEQSIKIPATEPRTARTRVAGTDCNNGAKDKDDDCFDDCDDFDSVAAKVLHAHVVWAQARRRVSDD